MQLSFCERWFRHQKKMIKPLKEKKARQLDASGKPYTIVIGDPDQPYCFIERNKLYYGVHFFDQLKRVYLIYSFDEAGENKLFLNEAIYHSYDGDNDEVLEGTIYWFSPNGKVTIEKVEYPSNKARRIEKTIDVSKNWEDIPEFGHYENLLEIERF